MDIRAQSILQPSPLLWIRRLLVVTVCAVLSSVPNGGAEVSKSILVIPGVAHIHGFNGTDWRTRLVVYNPGTEVAAVTIEALERDRDNSEPATTGATLEAGTVAVFDDVLHTLFGIDGVAALRISTNSGSVVASARTSNVAGGDGSVGQLIEAFTTDATIQPGEVAHLLHVSQSVSPDTERRTAIGIVNLERATTAVLVEVFRADGMRLGSETFLLRPLEYRQIERIVLRIAGVGVDDGFALVRAVHPASPFLAYATVVDNRTGDPMLIPARRAPYPSGVETVTTILPGGVPLELVRVPPGAFIMGSPMTERGRRDNEGPAHLVTLTEAFFIGRHEITQAQWKAVTGTLPSGVDVEEPGQPAHSVSWDDIAGPDGFLDQLNAFLSANGPSGTGTMRLPTEAEWEHAARTGSTTRFFFGDALDCGDQCEQCLAADRFVWWCGNQLVGPWGLKPTARKQASAFGLFDMHGNVWEWVADLYGVYGAEPVIDPTGSASGSLRVFRGGDSDSALSLCRSAVRGGFPPEHTGTNIGFRIAR
ncbi:MAG: formylglycine-generating enzyme family protein [bacterium]|nr:formylglycine-generating enzyme family protein [bacterium]